jgi:hypothetical protein
MIRLRRSIKVLEKILGGAILASALFGLINEAHLENPKVREYSREAAAYLLLPLVLIEEYRRAYTRIRTGSNS